MEPFRVGTGRLPVYTMSGNRSVQNCSLQCIHARTIPNNSPSLHSSRTRNILEKVFPPTCSSNPYTKFSSRANFSVIVSWISPCLISKRTRWEWFWVFTLELFGSVSCGTYILGQGWPNSERQRAALFNVIPQRATSNSRGHMSITFILSSHTKAHLIELKWSKNHT